MSVDCLTSGIKKDKFKTKAFDRSATEIYCVRALAFSPDGAKLAVAQSDGCVFVYRYSGFYVLYQRLEQVSIVWEKNGVRRKRYATNSIAQDR